MPSHCSHSGSERPGSSWARSRVRIKPFGRSGGPDELWKVTKTTRGKPRSSLPRKLLYQLTGLDHRWDVHCAYMITDQVLRSLHIEVSVGDDAIRALHSLPRLEDVYLHAASKVTEKGYRELCEALPDCLVQWNGNRHPHVSQIERIEAWHSAPCERPIVTVVDCDTITGIKNWLENYQAKREFATGWKQGNEDGPSNANMILRIVGKGRVIQEIPFGNGAFQCNRIVYHSMASNDEDELLSLLGIMQTDSLD